MALNLTQLFQISFLIAAYCLEVVVHSVVVCELHHESQLTVLNLLSYISLNSNDNECATTC